MSCLLKTLKHNIDHPRPIKVLFEKKQYLYLLYKSKGLLRRRKSAICLYHDRSVDNIEKYKGAKKTAKRAVSVAKGRAYEDLYQRLSTKEGEKDIYSMAMVHERKTRDFNQVKCIKDEREHLLVKE